MPGQRLVDFEQVRSEAPAVSLGMIKYLETMFTDPKIKPGIDHMSDHLIFQQGINSVLDHMRSLNERQEARIREQYSKD